MAGYGLCHQEMCIRDRVRNDQFDDIYAKVVSYGVLTLSKPTNMQMVAQNLRILCATRERMRQMEAKQATVEEKIEEIRLVNRAKWLLIECLGMTEPEAHRYIEKQSMDQRLSKREVAAVSYTHLSRHSGSSFQKNKKRRWRHKRYCL